MVEKIGIIGLGYVGLPTAVTFALNNVIVYGVDLDFDKINKINQGISPIQDTFLQNNINNLVKKGTLKVSTDYSILKDCEIKIIIVPTPSNENNEPDLSYIINASHSLSKYIKPNDTIILESTVYPGVTELIIKETIERTGLKYIDDFGIGYCPERFNPGDDFNNISKTTRIISASDEKTLMKINNLYSKIQSVHPVSSIKIAEATKVMENIQRDVNIALINEFAIISDLLKIDVTEILKAAATKWNFHKYFPSTGVGGHCLPHDPNYLIHLMKEHRYSPNMITNARKLNDSMPKYISTKIISILNSSKLNIKNINILILGATYKKNIDDIRSSPTEVLVSEFQNHGINTEIFDPFILSNAIFNTINYTQFNQIPKDKYQIILCAVSHDIFKTHLSELPSLFNHGHKFKLFYDSSNFINSKEQLPKGILLVRLGDGYS